MKLTRLLLLCVLLFSPSHAYSWTLVDDAIRVLLKSGRKIIGIRPKRSDVVITGIAITVGVVSIKLDDINSELDRIGLKLSGENSIDQEFLKDVVMAVADEQQKYISIEVCSKPNGDLFPAPDWFDVCPFSGRKPIIYTKKIPVSNII